MKEKKIDQIIKIFNDTCQPNNYFWYLFGNYNHLNHPNPKSKQGIQTDQIDQSPSNIQTTNYQDMNMKFNHSSQLIIDR